MFLQPVQELLGIRPQPSLHIFKCEYKVRIGHACPMLFRLDPECKSCEKIGVSFTVQLMIGEKPISWCCRKYICEKQEKYKIDWDGRYLEEFMWNANVKDIPLVSRWTFPDGRTRLANKFLIW